jgi:hypothetical protein
MYGDKCGLSNPVFLRSQNGVSEWIKRTFAPAGGIHDNTPVTTKINLRSKMTRSDGTEKVESLPATLPSNLENLEIEPTETKLPDPSMPIRTLEIDATGFARRIDIPTATAFVGNEG